MTSFSTVFRLYFQGQRLLIDLHPCVRTLVLVFLLGSVVLRKTRVMTPPYLHMYWLCDLQKFDRF